MSTVIKQYTQKPVEISAARWGGTAAEDREITGWLEKNLYVFLVGDATEPETLRYPDQVKDDNSKPDKGIYIDPADGALMIRTLEGDTRVTPGDYIIRGVEGEFYSCAPSIFKKTYAQVFTG